MWERTSARWEADKDVKDATYGATESDDNDELSSLSSEESFRRALSALPELAEPLPVERTFIQFSTRAFIHRRRSRSV
ncbi:hypothetical protein AK812_SmicGene38492 [Symbiodinium microadriaticum]|uniref:Uncharacterized protein n=1 Tax=Symbiodinium microadriaticum TaxID=2951 RepID=A0A1Q9CDP8_SYMMI|nr:hypothetical protein AK812_SmicGene38492 [Symbiodinium microadriaticum]